jgi:hypothetical protein
MIRHPNRPFTRTIENLIETETFVRIDLIHPQGTNDA